MTILPFLLPYFAPAAMIAGYLAESHRGLQVVVWMYLAATVLDVFGGPNAPVRREGGIGWRLAIWLWPPAHLAALACGLAAVANRTWTDSGPVLWQNGVVLGMTGGMFGVVVAHELMHGSSRWERGLAEMLMTVMSYPHWCIEHIHGHHRRVGTMADPATARVGESLYAFFPRAVVGSLSSAWQIEQRRLRSKGNGAIHNRFLRYSAVLAVLYSAVYLAFGQSGLVLLVIQGVVAFSVLEVLNYVGHYGLTRREIRDGMHEPVGIEHSWNANYAASNWLLFNVGLHADHHCHPGKSYECLEDRKEAPQLPAGYLAMFVLALIPPAWQFVMDPRAELWRRQQMTVMEERG
jgi:alkane 1-monooxygenase